MGQLQLKQSVVHARNRFERAFRTSCSEDAMSCDLSMCKSDFDEAHRAKTLFESTLSANQKPKASTIL
jgi:hypothetical protein